MDQLENQHTTDEPHRSFVVSDFSVRDIPIALLTYVIICVVCVVLGPVSYTHLRAHET